MPMRTSARWLVSAIILAAALPFQAFALHAQERAPAIDTAPRADEDLSQVQTRLADRYDLLESHVARLAELTGSTQPRRAAILRQLFAQSRDRDVAGQFDNVVAALDDGKFPTAIEGQVALEAELQKLLELLLQEDRDRQIESERKRVARYLQNVNRLIRLQRGVKARTDGGDEAKELAEDQKSVGDQTKKLGDEIAQSEETAEQKARRESGKESPGEQGGQSKPSDGQSEGGSPKPDADKKTGEPKPSEGQSESPKGEENEPSRSESGEGLPSPIQGKQSQGKPSQGQPSQGQQGSPGDGQQSPSEQESQQSPAQRAAQRLQQAQQRMQDAQKQLEDAKREGAVKDQERAVEELEQAKAELERILRQLREEELERMLVMLEARLRKMLEEQVEVYEETKRLDAASNKAPEHELEIAGGRLARQEGLIVREADRALVLLREDGTSIAFPETIEQAREDMKSIEERLRDTKANLITQALEEDVIAALEESLAALQQALKELREQKGQPQQGGGSPGEKPLVDQIAELRMIRSLQARINRRTQQYGAMIEGEQALADELIKSLRELSIRQQKIILAMQDLSTKEN